MSYYRFTARGEEALTQIASRHRLALYTEHSSPTREERRVTPADCEAYNCILYIQPEHSVLDDLGEAQQQLQAGQGMQGRWLTERHGSAPELTEVLGMLALQAWAQLPAGEAQRDRLERLIGINDLTTLSGLVLAGDLNIKEERP